MFTQSIDIKNNKVVHKGTSDDNRRERRRREDAPSSDEVVLRSPRSRRR